MNLGQMKKTINSSRQFYMKELGIGLVGILITLYPPIREGFFEKYGLLALPLDNIVLVLAVILALVNLFKIIVLDRTNIIEIYEKGIKIKNFKEEFRNLKITIKGGRINFQGKNESYLFKDKLSREDFEYLEELEKNMEKTK